MLSGNDDCECSIEVCFEWYSSNNSNDDITEKLHESIVTFL